MFDGKVAELSNLFFCNIGTGHTKNHLPCAFYKTVGGLLMMYKDGSCCDNF
jgi:hypothetical protein